MSSASWTLADRRVHTASLYRPLSAYPLAAPVADDSVEELGEDGLTVLEIFGTAQAAAVDEDTVVAAAEAAAAVAAVAVAAAAAAAAVAHSCSNEP